MRVTLPFQNVPRQSFRLCCYCYVYSFLQHGCCLCRKPSIHLVSIPGNGKKGGKKKKRKKERVKDNVCSCSVLVNINFGYRSRCRKKGAAKVLVRVCEGACGEYVGCTQRKAGLLRLQRTYNEPTGGCAVLLSSILITWL